MDQNEAPSSSKSDVTTTKGHEDPVFFSPGEDTTTTIDTTATTTTPSSRQHQHDHQKEEQEGKIQSLTNPSQTIQVSLTHAPLSLQTAQKFVSSPMAGANVFFTGTTRNTFESLPVSRLEYTSYPPLALKTMMQLCTRVFSKHSLRAENGVDRGIVKIYLIHRLGIVDVGEESIIIGVSSAHRKTGWEAGEEILEEVKTSVEIWKREWFTDGRVTAGGRDGEMGVVVEGGSSGERQTEGGKIPSDDNKTPRQEETQPERGEWRANRDKDAHGNRIL